VQYKTSTESVLAVMTASESVATQAPVTCTVTLQAGAPWFELEITLHDKSADPWPEAGWICLPIRAPNPQFRIARQVGIMDPTRDIIRGANRHLYAVHSGLTISDQQGRGAAICPLDHPLISLGEPGCWRYSLEYTPDQPVAFVNLFNNQWTTNFRFWNAGRISSRVRIWAVDGDTGTSWISRAMEARHPLLAVASTGEAGRGRVVPSMQPGLQVSRQGVVVTAFGENPDGAGVLLRLWEHEGRAGKAMVQLPAGLAVNSAQPVDLRGTPVGAATSIQSGKLPVNFRAFAPVSFILSRTSGD
jgi:hypothetical protein